MSTKKTTETKIRAIYMFLGAISAHHMAFLDSLRSIMEEALQSIQTIIFVKLCLTL